MKTSTSPKLRSKEEEEGFNPKTVLFHLLTSLPLSDYSRQYPVLGSASPLSSPSPQASPSWTSLTYDHIIEAYDFDPSMKTADIDDYFKDFTISIRWVDDSHVLIIFPDSGTGAFFKNQSLTCFSGVCVGHKKSSLLASQSFFSSLNQSQTALEGEGYVILRSTINNSFSTRNGTFTTPEKICSGCCQINQ
jgi:hypothetical protein